MVSAFGNSLRQLPGPILLTGHTGFKGTWLTLLLEHLQVPVVGYSLPADKDSLFDRANRAGCIPEAFADIRDPTSLRSFLELHRPAAVIHMAAQPLVLESYKTPLETFEINVIGTANLLSAAFATESVKAVGVITTDKVYRNDNSGRAFIESDALAGKDPYSASKVGTESVVAAWQQIAKVSKGPQVIALRAGNVIGGGDWAEDRLIPDLIKAFTGTKKIVLRNPESTRPWQHVLDPLVGYLMAIEKILAGEQIDALNFGPDSKSLTVKKIAEISQARWPFLVEVGSSTATATVTATSESEALALDLDSQRARNVLQWRPAWTQEGAVVSSIRWWDSVLNDEIDPLVACASDIDFALKSLSSLGNS
jgi:CDP-glucose 4,6-dehydratase